MTRLVERFGRMVFSLFSTLRQLVAPHFEIANTFKQMLEVGVRSMPVVIVTAVFIGVNYFMSRNLFVSAGGDNLLNRKYRGGYVGMGVRFEGGDFKYLMGTIPRISTQ